LAVLAALAGGIALYYVAFGGSTAAGLIAQFEQQYGRYTMSLSEILGLPWQRWGENAAAVVRWSAQLLTIPLSLAAVAALLTTPWLGRRAWPLALWVVAPVVGQIAITARFFDRYILFSIPPLLILIARSWEILYERLSAQPRLGDIKVGARPLVPAFGAVALALLLLAPTIQSVTLLTNVNAANRAVNGYYGLWALRDYIKDRARATPVYLIVKYSPSPVEDGAVALLNRAADVTVLRVVPTNNKLTIFDPLSKRIYPKDFFQGKDVYYAATAGEEASSWLAGRIDPLQRFPNQTADGSEVGLYRIRFDDSFQ
jgi:hypothetical protein